MLPCSVRRVAATAPQSPILSNFGSAVPRSVATSVVLSYRQNQRRRYSSSKPSPDNGSEGIPVRQSAQPTESKTGEAKSSGEKRKRKAKEVAEKQKYPSVPTTAHIPSDFLALSSFFSLHRPISVTRGLPRNVTEDAFASIFAQQTRSQKASEVMTTLSRTVQELEQPMANLGLQQDAAQQNNNNHDEGMHHKIDIRNPDGTEMSVTVQVNAMSGQFLPFRPPPLPQPQSASTTNAEAAETSQDAAMMEEDHQSQTRLYKAVFTIEETTDGNGEVKIVAHSPEVIEERASEAPRSVEASTFLERMALRQLRHERHEDARVRRPSLLAISVKRQRKLKMKKKKYKKLMKRLRHERLRHGRT